MPVVDVPEQRRRADHRYGALAAALTEPAAVLDVAAAALACWTAVRQGHTRWSVTYGLRSGEVRLVTATGAGERRYRLPMS